MRAFRCDSCGELCSLEDVAQLVVTLPGAEDEKGVSHPVEWMSVDVCGTCLGRSAREVIEAACLGFDVAWGERKAQANAESEATP